ncbi:MULTISPECIES: thioesterase family protein [unclassified Planococcus (in: firmicutes)]|uniref:acyl-CoA thioesterase n=1 Tax=unclassified Planococcus (in: firmicutes) TaxID=2662419 RepID=UPI000C7D25B1|nr:MULTISPECIES: acyl-CoA thioesterase [unclassified Planococcus (in: firmicutes)]PKG44461.1 acyl-CoA thioesterase [Planococcus sp. Urea-trap-24]PKG91277.1 acyl-CoA thioesterase [Planococcus sp. Urea-3u-39]PKH39842.1 acyl-CoA thioesterase [Planococcus sp. MB-3u-09]
MRASYINDFNEWQKGFSFYAPVHVRFSETDMFGHVNNTVPIAYFEYARIEFMKEMGLMQGWLSQGSDLIPVVADMQVDFVRQVFFDEQLRIYVKVESIGSSSADIHYWAVNDKQETCFTGRGAIVQISKTSGKGHPWSDEEKTMLQSGNMASSGK